MASPATEDLRELERLLVVSADHGESMSEAALRDELGAGHEDLQKMLSTLREVGKAVEEAPGEWRAGDGTVAGDAAVEPVRVHVAEEPERRGPSFDASKLGPPFGWAERPVRPSVRLTRGMVEALEPDALGKLIQAGIADVQDGATFVLEVGP